MSKKAFDTLTETMFYVLLSLMSGEKCGTQIAEHVNGLTEGRVGLGPGTLYTILGKFESSKLIEETFSEGRKRVYRLTEKGKTTFSEELSRIKRCIADAERELV